MNSGPFYEVSCCASSKQKNYQILRNELALCIKRTRVITSLLIVFYNSFTSSFSPFEPNSERRQKNIWTGMFMSQVKLKFQGKCNKNKKVYLRGTI